jgi:dTDP-4-amino-4,6-dideoxygalactose transaminase
MPIVLLNSNSEKRNLVRNKLAEFGIQTSVHYPAVHRFSIYRDISTELPLTDYVADNLITLPMYSKLGEDKVDFVVDKLKKLI